jgi:YHS domain-containing protein
MMMISKLRQTISVLTLAVAALFVSSVPLYGGELVNTSGESGVALNGYDPVAFFTDKKPVNGNFKISATHRGATYFFASEDHKATFEGNPDKYAPQCGGYCAFGVSVGALFPVDINTWQVRNDKLYLNLNPGILAMFNQDIDGNIAKANTNWVELQKKHSKSKDAMMAK